MDGMTNCIPTKENKESKSQKSKKEDPGQGIFTFMDKNDYDNDKGYKYKNDGCWTFDWQLNNPVPFHDLLNNK